MKVSELIEWLSLQDKDDDLTFYFLKNDVLTNCQLETIIETDMGVELTIQDTNELQEDLAEWDTIHPMKLVLVI